VVAGGPRLYVVTRVTAPVATVLAASLDLDVELAAVRRYGVRTGPPGTCSSGCIGLDETVTWQLRLLGIGVPLHTSRIVELVPDDGSGGARFVDAMEHGLFAAFRHEHVLVPAGPDGRQGTVMHDDVRWRSPLGVLGRVADALFVRRALLALLRRRNAEIERHVAAR
jgi:ligand-binding SRPBCC domain-containing protein